MNEEDFKFQLGVLQKVVSALGKEVSELKDRVCVLEVWESRK